jgi:hypothetical protein
MGTLIVQHDAKAVVYASEALKYFKYAVHIAYIGKYLFGFDMILDAYKLYEDIQNLCKKILSKCQ